jgi:hypothetical protein
VVKQPKTSAAFHEPQSALSPDGAMTPKGFLPPPADGKKEAADRNWFYESCLRLWQCRACEYRRRSNSSSNLSRNANRPWYRLHCRALNSFKTMRMSVSPSSVPCFFYETAPKYIRYVRRRPASLAHSLIMSAI